jgi:hypothetical protein
MKRLRDARLVANVAALAVAAALTSCNGELALFERAAPLTGGAGESAATAGSTSGSAGVGAVQGLGGADDGSAGANGAAGSGSSAAGFRLIDDFEDGDSHAAGNFGWWWSTNDGTGVQGWGFEPVSGRAGNTLAVRTHGGDFTEWGAILGVNLRGSSAFDASAYDALWFWARAEPQSTHSVSAQISDGSGVRGLFAVTLSDEWAEYRVPFDELRSTGGVLVNPETFFTVQFLFPPRQAFDVWFDDLAFGP